MNLEYPIRQISQYAYSLKSSVLGQTDNSKVYQGIDTLSNEPVAIKVVQLGKMNQAQVKMLYNEIQMMHQLKKSLNIIKVLKVYQAEKQIFIVMQRCNGDLDTLLKVQKGQGRGLQEKKAMQIMNQIIIGYRKIYHSRIIHRDLKLANILLKNGRVKIADFGYAIRGKHDSAIGMIKTKQNVGSPIYMAPESLNKNIYSYKSDIWALGVIFYQLLFGKQPWSAISEEQLSRQLSCFNLHDKISLKICQQSYTFLYKTLNRDLQQRFDPQQFIKFSFSLPDHSREDSLSTAHQSPLHRIFGKVSYISQRPESPIFQKMRYKFNSEPMSVRSNYRSPKNRTSIIKDSLREQGLNLDSNKQRIKFPFKSKLMQSKLSFASPKASSDRQSFNQLFNMCQRQTKIAKENLKDLANSDIEIQPQVEKNITDFLKYQIHLCRFMEKIVSRIQIFKSKRLCESDDLKSTLNDDFMSAISAYLLYKTHQISALQTINPCFAQIYRAKSCNFQQIQKYANQCHNKFQLQFGSHIQRKKYQKKQCKQVVLERLNQYVKSHSKISQLFYGSNIQQQIIFVEYLNQIRKAIQIIQNRSFYLNFSTTLGTSEIQGDRKKIEQILKKIGQLRKYQISLRQLSK